MKKIAYWCVIVGLSVFSILLLVTNRQLKERIEQFSNGSSWITESENTVLVVDTIYNERYVVAVDTVSGKAKILGLRRFCEEIEGYEE